MLTLITAGPLATDSAKTRERAVENLADDVHGGDARGEVADVHRRCFLSTSGGTATTFPIAGGEAPEPPAPGPPAPGLARGRAARRRAGAAAGRAWRGSPYRRTRREGMRGGAAAGEGGACGSGSESDGDDARLLDRRGRHRASEKRDREDDAAGASGDARSRRERERSLTPTLSLSRRARGPSACADLLLRATLGEFNSTGLSSRCRLPWRRDDECFRSRSRSECAAGRRGGRDRRAAENPTRARRP